MSRKRTRPRAGDWLKESWCFHGFSGTGAPGFDDTTEYVGPPVFRFVSYSPDTTYDSSRVNRMGWPVSRYAIEIVTEDEMAALIKGARWDDYYHVYRAAEAEVHS